METRAQSAKSSFRQSAKQTLNSVISIATDSSEIIHMKTMDMKEERDSVLSSSKSDPLDEELYNSHEEEGKNLDEIDPIEDALIDNEMLEVVEEIDLSPIRDRPWRLNRIAQATPKTYSFMETSYESEPSDSDDEFEIKGSDLARAHWIQLSKTNKQTIVIQQTFLELLKNYKHLRPIWQFGRQIETTDGNWGKRLCEDAYFKHHCTAIQAAFTMLMEHKDESGSISRLLNEIGAHHFFYDATEAHFECFQSAFLEAIRKKCVGVSKMDSETEISWKTFLSEIKTRISEGIAIQRINYLKMAITGAEIEQLKKNWEMVVDFGLNEAGLFMCKEAIEHYEYLIKEFNLENRMPEMEKEPEILTQFVTMTMTAFNLSIESWTHTEGFMGLPELLRNYVVQCLLLDVCPTLLRKAVQHGLSKMLRRVLGGEKVNENVEQMWKKMYRVVEQAIIADISDY